MPDSNPGKQSDPRRNPSCFKNWDPVFSPGRFAIFLAVIIAVTFSDVVLGGATFFVRDYARFGFPLALFHQDNFWTGQIPLWNPYNSCGIPFLAQWNTLTLYPGSLLYLMLPLSWGLSLFTLLHLFFGGMGMYMLSRYLTGWRIAGVVAGVAYTFNGFTLNALMWPNYLVSIGWLPWMLLAADRALEQGGSRVFAAGVLCALQLLSGTPELTALSWLVLGCFTLARIVDGRTGFWVASRRLTTLLGIGLLLSSVQLLPFLELLRHSERSGDYVGQMWSMLPTGWARLVLPDYYGVTTSMGIVMDPAQSFTNSYYPGTAVLLLASLSTIRSRGILVPTLIVSCLLALTLSLGEFGYLYPFLLQVFPPIAFMRYPVKFVMLLTLVAPLLAGSGMAALASGCRLNPESRFIRSRILIVGLILVGTIGFLVWFDRRFPVMVGNVFWSVATPNGAARAAFLIVSAGVLLLFSRSEKLKPWMMLSVLFVTVLWLDLLTHTARQNPTVPRTAYQRGFAAMDEMDPKPALGMSRAVVAPATDVRFQTGWIPDPFQNVLLTRLGMTGNANIIDKIPKVGGFYALTLQRTADVEGLLFFSQNDCRTNIADFLSVSQVNQLLIEPSTDPDSPDAVPLKPFEWTPRRSYLPYITAGMQPLYQHPTNVLGCLQSEAFDPRSTVVLTENLQPVMTPVDAQVFPREFTAHRVQFDVQSSAPTLAVVAQSFYPPWKAYVDGTRVPLLRANHAFQAVRIEAGTHEVLLQYEDLVFRWGGAISGSVFIAGCVFHYRNRFLPPLRLTLKPRLKR